MADDADLQLDINPRHLLIRAMREVDPAYDLFHRADEPAAIGLISYYFSLMPQTGARSRCEVLRRYMILAALETNDHSAADVIARAPDSAIIRAARRRGLPI